MNINVLGLLYRKANISSSVLLVEKFDIQFQSLLKLGFKVPSDSYPSVMPKIMVAQW